MPTSSTVEYLEPFPADQLPDVAGGWEHKELTVGGQKFRLIRPAQPDALLDTPETLAAHQADGYMPYWGYLWPTALDMTHALLTSSLPDKLPTLEIGAGIGLAGLGALASGLEVTFSDYDRTAVRLALANSQLNGFSRARGMFLDWRDPPHEQFPLILGCDVIYERDNHEPILGLLDRMLTRDGQCWLADPGRYQADAFVELARSRGYQIERRREPRQPFPTRPDGFTDIWILRHSTSST